MACRHENSGVCKIINQKCAFIISDEKRCGDENGEIIRYLKVMGTYDKMVKNNPEYISE